MRSVFPTQGLLLSLMITLATSVLLHQENQLMGIPPYDLTLNNCSGDLQTSFQSIVTNQNTNNNSRGNSNHYNPILEQFLLTAIRVENVSSLCKEHCRNTLLSLSTIIPYVWGLKMADASAKIPSGVVEGNLRWMGSYSECLSVETEDFQGQYCAIRPIKSEGCNLSPIYFAICIPSTCTPQDIQLVLNEAYPFPSFTVGSCQVEGKREIDNTAIGVISLYSFFWFVIFTATIFDCYVRCMRQNNAGNSLGMFGNILLAFSLYTNTLKLMNTEQKGDSLNFLHGMRFFSMTWVILGHTYSFMTQAVTFKNYWDIIRIKDNFAFMPIFNGTFSVDTYFFLSGFLVSYVVINEMRKRGGKFDVVRFYLHRIWRLTPAYAMVIAWAAGFWYIMAQGPLWPNYKVLQTDCRKNWWKHLLYIHNFFTDGQLCLTVSWYLAADMQMYILSPIIIYCLYKYRRVGKVVCGAFLFATLLTAMIIYIVNDYPGIYIISYPKDPQALIEMQRYIYIRFYCRMGPYIVGIYVAYYMRTNENRRKMTKVTVFVCWILAFVLGFGIVYGPYPYFSLQQELNSVFSVIYGTFGRTLWAVCLGWVVYACANGYGGIINRFLSWTFFIPLSRLSYCAYLVQNYTFHLFFATRENEFYFDQYLMVYFFLGSLFFAYFVAYFMSMAFEAPMLRLEMVIFPKEKSNVPAQQFHRNASEPRTE